MTYFRMQPLSHGTGPLAPGHVAMPLPGVTSLSATPTRRRLAVKVQPPRAYLRAARYLPRAGFRPREAPVGHLAGEEKADHAGGQRRGSCPSGGEVQTGSSTEPLRRWYRLSSTGGREAGTRKGRVFLSSRLQTWLLLAIVLPLARGCLFIVSPWPLTAETRQPARQDCLTGPTRQWLRYPGASRAGPGARQGDAPPAGRIVPLSTRPSARPRTRRACPGLEDEQPRPRPFALQSTDQALACPGGR